MIEALAVASGILAIFSEDEGGEGAFRSLERAWMLKDPKLVQKFTTDELELLEDWVRQATSLADLCHRLEIYGYVEPWSIKEYGIPRFGNKEIRTVTDLKTTQNDPTTLLLVKTCVERARDGGKDDPNDPDLYPGDARFYYQRGLSAKESVISWDDDDVLLQEPHPRRGKEGLRAPRLKIVSREALFSSGMASDLYEDASIWLLGVDHIWLDGTAYAVESRTERKIARSHMWGTGYESSVIYRGIPEQDEFSLDDNFERGEWGEEESEDDDD